MKLKVIDWLLSIEGKIVWIIGSNSLVDLRIAIIGYMEAERCSNGNNDDPFFPGFQRYVECTYRVAQTSKSWARLITENTMDNNDAIKTFYNLLRDYVKTIENSK